jgi:hypothetical protein
MRFTATVATIIMVMLSHTVAALPTKASGDEARVSLNAYFVNLESL